MDAKKIFSRIQKLPRKVYSLSLNKEVMEAFQKKVGKSRVSQAVEELMKSFLEDLEKEKK